MKQCRENLERLHRTESALVRGLNKDHLPDQYGGSSVARRLDRFSLSNEGRNRDAEAGNKAAERETVNF